MPLVGFVDPSHDEYRERAPGEYPKWYPVEDVLQMALNADPKWSPWPYELIKGIADAHQERDYVSTTMLTGKCPRSAVIERKEDYVARIADYYASYRGTLFHAMLEDHARPGSVAEARFHTTVAGVPLSCSPDLLTPDRVYDYKMTENVPTFGYPWPNHKMQLQYNRYIVNHAERWEQNGEPFEMPFDPRNAAFKRLVVVYLGPKGPKQIECMESIQVPKKTGPGTKSAKVPSVWADEDVLDDMLPRLRAMQRALEFYPTWPDGLEDEPGWAGPKGWACAGPPLCSLPNCHAKRYPHGLIW